MRVGILCLVGLIFLSSAGTIVSAFTISTDKSTYSFGETIEVTLVYEVPYAEALVQIFGQILPQGECSYLGPFDSRTFPMVIGVYETKVYVPIPYGYSPGTWRVAITVQEWHDSTGEIGTDYLDVTVVDDGVAPSIPLMPMAPAIVAGLAATAFVCRRRG
jgi:hypothetical protein